MKKYIYSLVFFCFSLDASAANTDITYSFLAGQPNPATIDLHQVKKSVEGLTWSYKASCDDQKPTEGLDPGKVFDCDTEGDDGSRLNIKLIDKRAGTGKILVRAVGQKNNKVEYVQDINYVIKVSLPRAEGSSGCIELDCDFYTGFYIGVEGTSVENINEKGGMRIQYTGYSHFGLNKEKNFFSGVDIYGDLMQTNLQEQAAIESSCKADGEDENKKCEIKSTVAASFGIFAPFSDWSGDDKQIGPSFEYLGQKLNGDDQFAKSYYGGLRLAYSKIRHFSIAYGKTEGIPGHRVKFSGQLPIAEEKLLAGFTLNVASDDTAEELGVSSGDSVSIYIITQVDFTKIFPKLSQ